MYGEWDDLSFNFVPYKDTGVNILSAVEDIQVRLSCLSPSSTSQIDPPSPQIKDFTFANLEKLHKLKSWDFQSLSYLFSLIYY